MAEPTEAAPVREWLAGSLRVTLFATTDVRPFPRGWWTTVTGTEPESVTRPKLGGMQESGEFRPGQTLVLEISANRINWQLISVADPEKLGVEIPNIGPFSTAKNDFLSALEKWFPSAPACNRVAFGGQLFWPTNSKAETYALLSSHLPFPLDPENEGDFGYNINRYARSRTGEPGIRMNRLRKWNAVSFQLRAGEPGQALGVVREKEAAFLELDINTDADRREPFSAEKLPAIISELADLGAAIAAGEEKT